MKLDVWVTIGRPGESVFFETESMGVDLATDGKDDMRALVFELPLGARLDGRGPLRVMLEPRQDLAEVAASHDLATRSRKGGLWGGDVIRALREKGLIPNMVKRVILDCPHDDFVTIHLEGALDNEKSIDVIPALLIGAMVAEREPGIFEPSTPTPPDIDPNEIPF